MAALVTGLDPGKYVENGDLVVEVVRDPDEFRSMSVEWDRLAECLGDRGLFASHAWSMLAWRRHEALRGRRMHVITVRDGAKKLALAAPLVRIADWFGTGTLVPLDSMTPQYNDILAAEDETLPALLHAFSNYLRRHRRIRCLKLTGVRANSTTARMLEAIGARVTWETAAQMLDLTPFKGREEFLSSRSSNTKYKFRWQLRSLGKHGQVRFRRIGAGPELKGAVRWIFERKAKWVVEKFGEANWVSAEGAAEFFIDIAELEANRGAAHVAALELDGALVAATLVFRRGGTTFASKLAYDPAWKSFSPGWLLMMNILFDACDQGDQVFDMMIGQDGWKGRFGGGSVPVRNYRLGNLPFSRAAGRGFVSSAL